MDIVEYNPILDIKNQQSNTYVCMFLKYILSQLNIEKNMLKIK